MNLNAGGRLARNFVLSLEDYSISEVYMKMYSIFELAKLAANAVASTWSLFKKPLKYNEKEEDVEQYLSRELSKSPNFVDAVENKKLAEEVLASVERWFGASLPDVNLPSFLNAIQSRIDKNYRLLNTSVLVYPSKFSV